MPKEETELPPKGEDEEAYSPDGVDLTLVRWMLSLTPEERLAVLQGNVESIERLKEGCREA